jgi:putative acyl-CoA dehydrogenase
VAREGGASAGATLTRWGATLGTAETYALADAANRHSPQLRSLDRRGERIDAIEFHPAWDALMRLATAEGEHCLPWVAPGPGAQVARAAMYFLHAQVENGTQCPLTMTFASVPVLARHAASIPGGNVWLQRALVRDYDPRPLPVTDKRAALLGMGMTERQGGSDVRANLTRAIPASDGAWRITGHKWFFSAPQCDAHLVLAQADAGITCFLLPRVLPDGTRNAVRINRLKDKLGNRSNASAEVEFDGALAYALGAPGRGIATILEMVQHTRLDCVIGSAGMMRGALAWALHHATHRVAFGRNLVDQPLMASGARRPGARSRRCYGADAAPRTRIRSAGGFIRARARAHRDAGREILDVQARTDGRAGGDGSAGRQRLRRGDAARARLSGSASQLDLGRIRQRDLPRRDARGRPGAGGVAGPRGRTPGSGRWQR